MHVILLKAKLHASTPESGVSGGDKATDLGLSVHSQGLQGSVRQLPGIDLPLFGQHRPPREGQGIVY